MRIIFVPDGGAVAGLGHLSRCLAVAEAFRVTSNIRPMFLSADSASRTWLAERDMDSTSDLSGSWDVMVVDSYVRSSAAIADLRARTKILTVFDDDGNLPDGAHWVINAGVGASGALYSHSRPGGLLLGPMFHPLRSEYWAPEPDKPTISAVQNVVITLGGGACEEMLSEMLVELRLVLPCSLLHVLVGPHAGVIELSSDEQDVVFHRAPQNVREVLALADVAVSAGGQTLYELAYLGIPTIAIETAPNQRNNILGFSDAGVLVDIGEIGMPIWKDKLKEALGTLITSPSKRRQMSDAGRHLIDSKGALRLAKVLAT